MLRQVHQECSKRMPLEKLIRMGFYQLSVAAAFPTRRIVAGIEIMYSRVLARDWLTRKYDRHFVGRLDWIKRVYKQFSKRKSKSGH